MIRSPGGRRGGVGLGQQLAHAVAVRGVGRAELFDAAPLHLVSAEALSDVRDLDRSLTSTSSALMARRGVLAQLFQSL